MRQNTFHYFMLTIILAVGLNSCSQKFPVPATESTGLLVVVHEAVNETKNDFGYRYILNYSPEASPEISIRPSTNKQFFIINNFPAGSYRISGVTTIGIVGGIDTPMTNKNVRSLNGESFEIKPKHITILKSKFGVSKKYVTTAKWRQSYKFERLDEKSLSDVIKKLKMLENSDRWVFYD